MKALLISSTQGSKELADGLNKNGVKLVAVVSGKEAQTQISANKYDIILLDIDVKNHGFIPVIKFIKIYSNKSILIMLAQSKDSLNELELTPSDISQMGVVDIVYSPWSVEKTLDLINKYNPYKGWQTITSHPSLDEASVKEEVISDRLFTSIPILSFSESNLAIFDTYIRLSPNKYLKIILRGEFIPAGRYRRYVEGHNVTDLYFKTEDRAMYINYMNSLLEKVTKNTSKTLSCDNQKAVTTVAEKFLEEVYTKGLSPEIYDEGVKICNHVTALIKNNDGLHKLLNKIPNTTKSHQVLTAIYAIAISEHEEWVGTRSRESLVMGSMLHNLGLLRLSWYDHESRPRLESMAENHRVAFKKYPEYGYEMLNGLPHISEGVRQIVLQHAEMSDGSGFPLGLTYQRTYPLARIVGLASYFSDKVLWEKRDPKEILKGILSDKKEVSHFHASLLKALIEGFIK